MSLHWDKISSRACKESDALAENEHPVLGSAEHAMDSPMPYGLGVSAVGEDGSKNPLPLFFVSEKAASTRGNGCAAGWYVVATPGTAFELRLTAIQPKFPHVNGETMPPGHAISATVFVEGLQVKTARAKKSFNELNIPGFVESWSYVAGDTEGSDCVRQFVFQKTRTVEEGVSKTEDAFGCILVQISSGRLGEKEAAKLGKSVTVGRDGRRTIASYNMLDSTIRNPHVESTFAIFLREKFWLESRRIIDMEGKPWSNISKPLPAPRFFGLMSNKRINAPEEDEDRKRQRWDTNRTIVKDFIDLTD